MSSKHKTGLGKGMGSLIDGYSLDMVLGKDRTPVYTEDKKNNNYTPIPSQDVIHEIALDKIHTNPDQPRKHFDEQALQDLSSSIQNQGVLQPIIVEEVTPGNYTIVAGERRYRASQMAGLKTIPSLVRTFSDMQRLEVALIENIQRENLNAIEEAKAYAYLLQQSNLTHDELSLKVGKSRSTITNSIRLLQLPKEVQDGVMNGTYSAGHARAFLSIVNPADRIIMLEILKTKHLSVREAEKFASQLNKGKRSLGKDSSQKKGNQEESGNGADPDVMDIQEKFIQALGCKVEIKGTANKGKITVSFTSSDELERIYQMISPNGDLFEL